MFSDTGAAIVAKLQQALHALDELKSQSERQLIYDAITAHLRNASPMSFAAPPPLIPEKDALIDLGEGRLVRLRILDGQLNMYVCEPGHDANVVLPEMAREQLRAALGVVR